MFDEGFVKAKSTADAVLPANIGRVVKVDGIRYPFVYLDKEGSLTSWCLYYSHSDQLCITVWWFRSVVTKWCKRAWCKERLFFQDHVYFLFYFAYLLLVNWRRRDSIECVLDRELEVC
jgi:hypothetical protein